MYVCLADVFANFSLNLHCPIAMSNMGEPPQSLPARRSDRVQQKRPNDGATDIPAALPKKLRKTKKSDTDGTPGPIADADPASALLPIPELPASATSATDGAAQAPTKAKKGKTKGTASTPTTSTSSVTHGAISIGAPFLVPPPANATEMPDDVAQPTPAAVKKTSRKKKAAESTPKGTPYVELIQLYDVNNARP
jgi:hypothetical protein